MRTTCNAECNEILLSERDGDLIRLRVEDEAGHGAEVQDGIGVALGDLDLLHQTGEEEKRLCPGELLADATPLAVTEMQHLVGANEGAVGVDEAVRIEAVWIFEQLGITMHRSGKRVDLRSCRRTAT